ncbi:MAG: T9SS type A sorting domain-containing protein [Flavobacteriales bacterium]|nr:T9SS type A sorting domain-containing protein [Flavobacteriales bacterium]
MKNIYVPALALALASCVASAQAQSNPQLGLKKQRLAAVSAHPSIPVPAISANRDILFTSDFSNAADWVIGNENDPNNDNWVIGTTAPSGSFSIPAIASTSAANGFALFDSDLLCGGSQNAWIAMAAPVNLTGYDNVVLRFEQYYREYQGMCYVETSTNGTDWGNTIQINDIGGNSSTANPQVLSVNLSSAIGGASAAWVRFRYMGGCDYAWMIDDVSIVTQPDNEMVMDYGFTSQTGTGYEYGRITANQMLPSLNVGAEIVNFGANDQTNVVVNVSFQDPSGVEIGTATTTVGTMVTGDTVLTDENIALSNPLAVGVYSAIFTFTSDQVALDDDPTNNSKTRKFEVTGDLYGLDVIGVVPDAELNLERYGTGSFADNEVDFGLLNYYQVNAQATYYGVQFLLGSESSAGAIYRAAVYDTTDVGSVLSNELTVSEDMVLTQAQVTAGVVNVQFLDPITLLPGGYYVALKLSKADGNDIYVLNDLTVPQPGAASLIYLPVDDQNLNLYSNGNAFAIRLSANPNVSVQEVSGLEGVSMYPNPTTGVLHINTAKAETTTVEVRNMLGAVVKTATFNGTVNTVDLRGNAAGVYSVRIGNGANYAVQLVTLQ